MPLGNIMFPLRATDDVTETPLSGVKIPFQVLRTV